MNDMISEDQKTNQEDLFKEVLIVCPECKTQKKLNVPSKIIEQSEHITTISIPTGLVCNHHFQAFVDKNCALRGYQLGDFEFSKIEYIESRDFDDQQKKVDDISEFTSLPLFQEILKLLRNSVDDREILGCAIFTTDGKVIYSSIPHNTLLNTIKEFEVRNEKKLHSITKMFLELKNQQKVCSEYIVIHNSEFILVILFSELVNFAIGHMFLRNIVKKIIKLT
ncbi:MAG: hypothetical protein JSV62_03455 [Promethearchaeota archaeon]|nr:MAG: hypothetical protein JSV62_03455 [Candidatus Lokiarchaeota archaeon]